VSTPYANTRECIADLLRMIAEQIGEDARHRGDPVSEKFGLELCRIAEQITARAEPEAEPKSAPTGITVADRIEAAKVLAELTATRSHLFENEDLHVVAMAMKAISLGRLQ
jgi:hypothetical protein